MSKFATFKFHGIVSSELGKSNMNSTVKIGGSNSIRIKSEPELPSPVASEQAGHLIEPNCTIVKSEYEFQSSYLHWTKDEAEDNDEFDDDCNDDDDDDDDDDDYNDDDSNDEYDDEDDYNDEDDGHFIRGHGKTEETNFDPTRINKTGSLNVIIKDKHFKEKRKFLESYMLQACPYCNNEFESFATWRTHMDDVHNHNIREETYFTNTDDGKAKCTECKTILVFRRETLKRHILMHLPHRNIYKCKLCSLVTGTNFAIFQHIERKHFDVVGESLSAFRSKATKVCAYCGKYVGVMQMVSMHIKEEHAGIFEQKLWYICPVCGEQFAEEKCHKEHLVSKHKFDTFEGMSFETIEGQETINGKKKYRCLKCNQQLFGSPFYFNTHALSHYPHKCYKCRFCDYTHDKKWKVIKHTCKDLLIDIKNNPNLTAETKSSNFKPPKSSLDAKNKLFVCPKCGESFEELSLWEMHLIKVHNFGEIESLNIKTTSEDGKSVTRCTICKKIFTKPHIYNLKNHAFTHMPYKLYKCKLCKAPLNSMITCSCKRRNRKTIIYVCPQCGRESKSQIQWNRHLKQMHDMRQPSGLGFSKIFLKANEAASYKCSDCGEIIKESEPLCTDLMFKHATIKHMPFKCYKCDKCGELSDSKDTMLEHSITCKLDLNRTNAEDGAECSKIAKCQCHVCGYLGENEEIVVTHLSNVHQLVTVENHIFTWFCSECEFKYDTKEDILDHVLSVHLKKTPSQSLTRFICFLCPVCNTEFKKKSEWYSHIFDQHELNTDKALKIEDLGKDWKCLECLKVYNKKSVRKFNHGIKHLPFEAFKCIICGLAFKDLTNARRHSSSCSIKSKEKKSIKGDTAENTVEITKRKPKNIQKFKKKHVKKPLSDPLQIDKSNVQNFSPTSMATSSPRTHAWNKYCKYMSYACPECNMPIATSEEWHLHISTHHDFFAEERLNTTPVPGTTYKRICDECGVTVHGSILHAQRHKLTHMPYQAFICKICQHRSKTNNVLIYHIERRHFTPGNYKCALCQEVFETCHKRFEHTKAVHTDDEWPDNVCRICMKELMTKYGLREHMKIHEFNRSVYECGLCTRKYYYRVERRKHWNQNHPNEYESMVEKEEQEKPVVQKPVRKTKKFKKRKIDPESGEPSNSDSSNYSSSDSTVLSKLKITDRITKINTRSMEVKDEPQSEVNNEETLLLKNEPESNDTIMLARLTPNKKRITNKTSRNEEKVKMKGQVKYETAFFNEQILKNEPRSDADDVDTDDEFIGV